jgi:ubiquinone/menaquinone biosynthesis C-methylase UbiE
MRGVGDEMAHMKPWMDEESRRETQMPEELLESIGLRRDMTFADIGCGIGFYALPAARIVRRKGRVMGVDVDDDSIAQLKSRAEGESLTNVRVAVGEAETYVPCEACADIVFFGMVLHDFRDPAAVLENARRIVKPGGKLVDFDWRKEQMDIGPPENIRFSEEKASGLIEAAGFKVTSVEPEGEMFYLISARPV